MLRAVAKGLVLAGFGHLPGGPRLYRELTRDRMGTQASHVDKLRRVWPGYVDLWRRRCGLSLAGADLWLHEAGWTPFPSLAAYLVTGKGGVMTNSEGRLLDRYVARAVNGALAARFADGVVDGERRRRVEALRWCQSAGEAIAAVNGRAVEDVDPRALPLPSASLDLCHSGGALEHYSPAVLADFLVECHRVLRPGGVASHVFDQRDHLYHSDRRYPFLAHLALPDALYRPLFGHPLGYHNRLFPAEVCRLFAAAGFEPIALRRLILVDDAPFGRYVDDPAETRRGRAGLPRRLLAPRYRDATDEDLHTAAVHYLFRKRS